MENLGTVNFFGYSPVLQDIEPYLQFSESPLGPEVYPVHSEPTGQGGRAGKRCAGVLPRPHQNHN